MKIVILGDTHIGMRNDSHRFHEYSELFYRDFLFPFIEKNKITKVFQLGDLFDRRKYINFFTLSEAKRYLFDPLENLGVEFHTLLGNHDIFWRESLSVSSTGLVLGEYDNLSMYDKPTTVHIGTTTIDLIPWICKENSGDIDAFIRNSKSDLCFGHFEISGFSMYRGVASHEGLSVDLFKKYEMVCSGHYHTRSQRGNITYVGTPMEITWQDYNDPRGFHVFDTETRKLEFYENPYKIFSRVVYDDSKEMPVVDFAQFKDKYLKVVVVSKNDYYKFDHFINSIYSSGAYEVKIVEDINEYSNGEIDDSINLENTVDVLNHYIDSVDISIDKEEVKRFMRELHVEASNLEII